MQVRTGSTHLPKQIQGKTPKLRLLLPGAKKYRTNRNVKLEGHPFKVDLGNAAPGDDHTDFWGGEGEMQDLATVNHISFFIACKIKK